MKELHTATIVWGNPYQSMTKKTFNTEEQLNSYMSGIGSGIDNMGFIADAVNTYDMSMKTIKKIMGKEFPKNIGEYDVFLAYGREDDVEFVDYNKFNSEEEREAFLAGVEDSVGWTAYELFDEVSEPKELYELIRANLDAYLSDIQNTDEAAPFLFDQLVYESPEATTVSEVGRVLFVGDKKVCFTSSDWVDWTSSRDIDKMSKFEQDKFYVVSSQADCEGGLTFLKGIYSSEEEAKEAKKTFDKNSDNYHYLITASDSQPRINQSNEANVETLVFHENEEVKYCGIKSSR